MKVGYARVSSADQNLDRQEHALKEYGVSKIFCEKITGSTLNRPELQRLLSFVREGDEIVCLSLDRICRSLKDFTALSDRMIEEGVSITFLSQPFLNIRPDKKDDPTTTFVRNMLAAISELERSMTRERQKQGIERARERGAYYRPPALNARQVKDIKRKAEEGVSKSKLARSYRVSRKTIYNVINGFGIYKNYSDDENNDKKGD